MENDSFDVSGENDLAPSSMNDWFYVSGPNELGPFSQEHLRELLAGGEIGPDTMVRNRAWMDWRKARECLSDDPARSKTASHKAKEGFNEVICGLLGIGFCFLLGLLLYCVPDLDFLLMGHGQLKLIPLLFLMAMVAIFRGLWKIRFRDSGTRLPSSVGSRRRKAYSRLRTTAPKPTDSDCAEEKNAGKTDPATAPDTRRKLQRRTLVIASIVVAVFIAAVAVGVRMGGNTPPVKEPKQPPVESLLEPIAGSPPAAAVEREPPHGWLDDLIVDTTSPAAAAVERGSAAHLKGNLDLAISEYTAAIRLDPKNTAAYYNRGLAYRSKREYDKAIADFTEYIRLDPKSGWAYYNRGRTYWDKREYDKAIADFTENVRLDPEDNWGARSGRGDAYRRRGDFDAAIADFSEAIRLHPKNTWEHAARGNAYMVKGDFDKAIADFSEAIRLDPKDADAYFNRGRAYEKKGETERARADFDQAKILGYKP